MPSVVYATYVVPYKEQVPAKISTPSNEVLYHTYFQAVFLGNAKEEYIQRPSGASSITWKNHDETFPTSPLFSLCVPPFFLVVDRIVSENCLHTYDLKLT